MKSKTYIIGISGASGSGKTTFAQNLVKKFTHDKTLLISQDSYYKDLSHLSLVERANENFDHPNSIDFKLLKKHLIELKKGNSISQPIYNFNSHSREKRTIKIGTKSVLIVEGTLLLSQPEIIEEIDCTIFINLDQNTCLERRMKRDISDRGRTKEEVLKQYKKTVKPMYELFIKPNENTANHIITGNNTQDDIADLYATILKDLKNKGFNLQ